MSIEIIALEYYIILPNSGTNLPAKLCPRREVFHPFLSYDRKHVAATTIPHIKLLIKLIK